MDANLQQLITGPPADAICAGYYTSQIALRLIKPGNSSSESSYAISRATAAFQPPASRRHINTHD
ncbi:hypothetical protein HK097_003477 [Rhizophlyctis rosea]|uniref:Uncharacterized protein n=1 Tax=Rhizophlyctis rosea TaxID=64517 RepID=A0AAD5SFJ1_9FUNG|nr:hypothetical protein HK097_003477 [Rhizophlyctis rosea]